MSTKPNFSWEALPQDLIAGVVVFLVALPLCLGVAMACGAPLISGVLAGIVGGLFVGFFSGSQTSVSGCSPGLTVIVAAQILSLGSFEAFLLAVVLAGALQIGLGWLRAGFLANFFPTSIIKGLLAAIGVILILKQIPHVLGRDSDPEGDMAFLQPDRETTFSELGELFGGMHAGAALVGLLSLVLLIVWERWKPLKRSVVPAALVVVILAVTLAAVLRGLGPSWDIGPLHLVQMPVAQSLSELPTFLRLPDFTQLLNPAIYTAAVTLALVASLETLLNLEAVDRLDPQQRRSPPNRELVAQGLGNIISGLVGGLPVSSAIVRSSVNINSGGQTKLATIIHGAILLGSAALLPTVLNLIPLSCLAAILLVTGVKLANPAQFRQMWRSGNSQFLPFVSTIVAIVLTDLLTGILIGFGVSLSFILASNIRRPLRRVVEKRIGGEVLGLYLANQVSFLNRATIQQALDGVPRGGHVLIDASETVYIDPDVLSLIREFRNHTAPARGVQVSMRGFRSYYPLEDEIQYLDHSTRELQSQLTPGQVLQVLQEGHERFRKGKPLPRDLRRLVHATADGQHPLACVVSCIDSRTPAEVIFDMNVGDMFSVRIAGNIPSRKVLGSLEFACGVAGAKLIVVMGHTRCGAVKAAVARKCGCSGPPGPLSCEHLGPILAEIQESVAPSLVQDFARLDSVGQERATDEVARRNVLRTVEIIRRESDTLRQLLATEQIGIVGVLYDVVSGHIEFCTNEPQAWPKVEASSAELSLEDNTLLIDATVPEGKPA